MQSARDTRHVGSGPTDGQVGSYVTSARDAHQVSFGTGASLVRRDVRCARAARSVGSGRTVGAHLTDVTSRSARRQPALRELIVSPGQTSRRLSSDVWSRMDRRRVDSRRTSGELRTHVRSARDRRHVYSVQSAGDRVHRRCLRLRHLAPFERNRGRCNFCRTNICTRHVPALLPRGAASLT